MSNRRGALLIISYILLTFFAAWTAVSFERSAIELNGAQRRLTTAQAFQVAEAGVSHAARWMRNLGSPPAGTNPFDPCTSGVPPLCAVCPCQIGTHTYTVTIDPDDNNPLGYQDVYTITVTGQLGGVAVAGHLTDVMRAESFSRYSYFTNSEKLGGTTPIWFTSRDHLEGPVHSNDQFNMMGNPVFDGPVSSVASSINYKSPPPAGGNNPQFNGGLSLSAPNVQLPLSVTQLRVAASSGGAWYSGNTTIALQPNGTMLVTNPTLGWVNMPQPLPVNGAIFVNGGNVTVSGTLDGALTIGTSKDLIIAGDVRYANNPQGDPQSDDILGLVSEQNVIVAKTAPFDITVQASVMALSSSFTVQEWWTGAPKGTLNVYGGIIQSARGPVGTFSSSTGLKLTGYSKDYRYDTRLTNMSPPFYPTTTQFQDVMWQEN